MSRHGLIVIIVVAVLLLLLVAELTISVWQQSQTYDEAYHLYSGYSYWKHGDYGINPEHPPLVKLLAAAPLLSMPLHDCIPTTDLFKVEGFVQGRDFLYSNDADRVLFRARMAASLLCVLLALLVFAATREMFGDTAALIALALVVFEPNILANGALVTTDVGISCFLLAAIYTFYRYVEFPTIGRLVTTGLACGLALASKHTGIFVAPILMLLAFSELVPSPVQIAGVDAGHKLTVRAVMRITVGSAVAFGGLWLVSGLSLGRSAGLMAALQYTCTLVLPLLMLKQLFEVLGSSSGAPVAWRRPIRHAVGLAGALLAIGAIAFFVLWCTYGFRYTARPAGLSLNPTLVEYQKQLESPPEEQLISTLARYRALPEAYLYGLVDIGIAGNSRTSYLLGRVYLHGRWFYFPMAFVIKSTAAFLTLVGLSAIAIGFDRLKARREILFLVIPIFFYFAVAMLSGLNIGIRHVLPVYPMFAILAGGGASALMRHDQRWRYVVVLLLAWHIVSSLGSLPNYLAYSNELWGGPAQTYKYLSDSSVDWGQQLKSVAKYLEQHRIHDCYFAYFAGPLVKLSHYGVHCKSLVTGPSLFLGNSIDVPSFIDGPVLISTTILSGSQFGPADMNPYAHFRDIQPTAVIDNGVLVFDGRHDMSLAAALNQASRAQHLLEDGSLDAALYEAQHAVKTAPESIQAQMALGDVLMKLSCSSEAHAAYQAALAAAQRLGPENQEWITAIKNTIEASQANRRR